MSRRPPGRHPWPPHAHSAHGIIQHFIGIFVDFWFLALIVPDVYDILTCNIVAHANSHEAPMIRLRGAGKDRERIFESICE
jgi:hypothetical protein